MSTVREIAQEILSGVPAGSRTKARARIRQLAAHVLALAGVSYVDDEMACPGCINRDKLIADLRAQLQTAQQARENMLSALDRYEHQVVSLQQLADERGREVEMSKSLWPATSARPWIATPAATPPAEKKEPEIFSDYNFGDEAQPPAQEHPDTASSFMIFSPLDQSPLITKTFEAAKALANEYMGKEDWDGEPVTKLGIYGIKRVGEVTARTAPEAQG